MYALSQGVDMVKLLLKLLVQKNNDLIIIKNNVENIEH